MWIAIIISPIISWQYKRPDLNQSPWFILQGQIAQAQVISLLLSFIWIHLNSTQMFLSVYLETPLLNNESTFLISQENLMSGYRVDVIVCKRCEVASFNGYVAPLTQYHLSMLPITTWYFEEEYFGNFPLDP